MQSTALTDGENGILELLSDGVIQVDYGWMVLYVNRAAERLLAAAPGQSRGKVLWDLIDGLPAEFISGLQQAESGTASCTYQTGQSGWRQVDVASASEGSRLVQIRDVTALKEAEAALDAITSQLQREIAGRRKAEDALEAKQEFLEAVLDNIQAGVVACDETGKLKLFNHATRTFHGVAEAPLPPEQWSEHYNLYHADGMTPLRKEEIPLYRAFTGEVVRNAEIVIAPKDGPRRTVLTSGRALMARDGRKLGAVVAMTDITHRRVSSGRVRHALRQYRALFNDAPVAYHEVDCFGIVRRVNRAECRLLERSREEIVGRPVWDLVAEHERESTRSAVLEGIAGPLPLQPVEREYITTSGKTLLFELHQNAIVDHTGTIVGIRTAMLDITERKRRQQQAQALIRETAAREQAEAASAELKNILERIGDAYIAFDADWRYTYVNQKAADLARKPASELIGRSVWDQFPEAVHTRFFSELQRSMREQAPVEFENYYAPLEKWFENTVYPSASGVGVFYRDITERKRTQRALEKRTAELAIKNAELETFAYVASHDLQEPLRMVAGYATLLARRYSGVIDEDADEFLRYITQGVGRMQRLVKDLLALCRLGTAEADRANEVNVARVIDYVCSNLELAIEDSGASIRCETLPTVQFNDTRLIQLMQNLIGNALRYRGQTPPEIRITAEREPDAWRFAVRDNGIGFEMRDAQRIFEPFRRLQRGDDGGTGIGLAICKKIVEGRGGRIWAESAPGSGSTFYFTVPDAISGGA
jgi:PAS domain S-box-containing protein